MIKITSIYKFVYLNELLYDSFKYTNYLKVRLLTRTNKKFVYLHELKFLLYIYANK